MLYGAKLIISMYKKNHSLAQAKRAHWQPVTNDEKRKQIKLKKMTSCPEYIVSKLEKHSIPTSLASSNLLREII